MVGSPPGARRAGVLVPLFSIPSSRSWGIGEIGDIEPMARWLASAGQRILQLLPINEMPPGETSPYSALSATAIDPQFISMTALEDVDAIGGEASLGPDLRTVLDAVRIAPAIDYAAVRNLKLTILRRAYTRFRDTEWAGGTRRSAAFRAYMEQQGWWLEDYALYWSEQYLLQAFLSGNPAWEVVVPLHALARQDEARLRAVLPGAPAGLGPGAFWIRRRPA